MAALLAALKDAQKAGCWVIHLVGKLGPMLAGLRGARKDRPWALRWVGLKADPKADLKDVN